MLENQAIAAALLNNEYLSRYAIDVTTGELGKKV